MPRTLDIGLQALIDSGRWEQHSAVDLTLTNDPAVYFSTYDGVIETREYRAKLGDISDLEMTTSPDPTNMTFKIQNIDSVFGQYLTGEERRLDGAKAVKGKIFLSLDNLEAYYVPEVPCELVTGDVDDMAVACEIISEVDMAIYNGDLVADEFASSENRSSPNPVGMLRPLNPLEGWPGRFPVEPPNDLPNEPLRPRRQFTID